ncbi:ribosylnicotinamide kinase [Vanrija albida]|uniref:Ribosylnicotinamide kinase n=1 Tax=Vanrija albida TaxID=181172 RepID=A0ABR3PRQ6_9TREE
MTRTRVILVGVGGASCAGKTSLAKHLRRLLPNALLLHMDDFAPASDDVPISAEHGIQDWDDPETCILWPKARAAIAQIKKSGALPAGHTSNDHLNQLSAVGIDAGVEAHWTAELRRVADDSTARGEEIVWVLVDGFVLYYDEVVAGLLDVKLFVQVPYGVLKARREKRSTYALQNPDSIGEVWTDPPNYFDNIVYPGYLKAHAHLFASGDVERGALLPGNGLTVLRPGEGEAGMSAAVGEACGVLVADVERGPRVFVEA